MGRKLQKSNRHKKLKAVDPFYVGERKLLIDKGLMKANKEPGAADFDVENEKLPMKLREAMELKDKIEEKLRQGSKMTKDKVGNDKFVKGGKAKRQMKLVKELLTNKPDDRGAQVPVRKYEGFKKKNNESEAQFLNRIERETHQVIQRSQYENQFEVKLETKDQQVVIKKDKKMSERKRRALEKLKDKTNAKKDKKKLNSLEKRLKNTETVRFGEVAHQPPSFTALPRKPKNKPKTEQSPKQPRVCPTLTQKTKNGLTEADRSMVIQRYRLLKSQGKFA